MHPSSYRNWPLTGTLQGGLQLKDPTGPVSCRPRAAVVVATVTCSGRMCPVVTVKEYLLVQRYGVRGGGVLSVMLLDGNGFDQKQPPFSHTHTLMHG